MTTIVHNYGHSGRRLVAVVGFEHDGAAPGAGDQRAETRRDRLRCARSHLGIARATLGPERMRIYAKELPPDVYSMRASGLWTPDSRICDAEHAPAFAARWEEMTRTSHRIPDACSACPEADRMDRQLRAFDTPWEQHTESVSDEPKYGSFRASVRDLRRARSNCLSGSRPFAQPYGRPLPQP